MIWQEWQVVALILLAWANGVFFGWVRWRKPQLDWARKQVNEYREKHSIKE